jgi:PKD domain
LTPNVKLTVLAGLSAAAVVMTAAGCGGGSNSNTGGAFKTRASASKFAGPAPLQTTFSAQATNAEGNVLYRWRFDDGTTSTQQSPAHSFPRPGYYLVVLDTRDSNGDSDRQSLLLGAWPAAQWAKSQNTQITRQSAIDVQKVQQARTDKRRNELRRQVRREVAQQSGSTSGSQ